jgi:hypothetical protein
MSYECESCDRWFTTWHGASQHMNALDHWALSFECQICDRDFTSETAASQHMYAMNHFTDRYCHDCERGFENPNNYRMVSLITSHQTNTYSKPSSIAIHAFIVEPQSYVPSAKSGLRRPVVSPIIWRLGRVQMPEEWTGIQSIANFGDEIQMELLRKISSDGTESPMSRTSRPIEPGTAMLLSVFCVQRNSESSTISINTSAHQHMHKSFTTAPMLAVQRNSSIWPPCSTILRAKAAVLRDSRKFRPTSTSFSLVGN